MKAIHTPGLSTLYLEGDANGCRFDINTEPSGQRRFWFVCPGCKSLSAIALRPVVDGSRQSWAFDGNLEAPTLDPSINHIGCWHGWLRGGEFTSC